MKRIRGKMIINGKIIYICFCYVFDTQFFLAYYHSRVKELFDIFGFFGFIIIIIIKRKWSLYYFVWELKSECIFFVHSCVFMMSYTCILEEKKLCSTDTTNYVCVANCINGKKKKEK